MPLLHALQAALLGGREPLALDRGAVDDDGPFRGQGVVQRLAQRADIVAVDHPDVGEVELLPPQARGPKRLQRLLDVRAKAFECRPDPHRQACQPALEVLARVPQRRVQADAVELPRERPHIGGDRHPIVVEQDHDRGSPAAGVLDRLEGHPAGHRAVADDGHHAAILAVAAAHPFLDPDRVTNRRGGVPGAHDVVLGLLDGAEGRQPAVLADRVQLVVAAREDLVRVGLVTDVPQNLVARGLEHRMNRDGDLARPEIGAEVAPDLPDGIDDPLAHLLGQGLKLLVRKRVEVLGPADALQMV